MIFIIGGGYVGIEYAKLVNGYKKNFKIIDIDLKRFKTITWLTADQYCLWSDVNVTTKNNIWMICVPTPITNDCKPDDVYIDQAISNILKHAVPDDLVICSSTVSVATIKRLNKLCNNAQLNFVHMPERMCPGQTVPTQQVHVIGSDNKYAIDFCTQFIRSIGLEVHIVNSVVIACLAKLFENTKRDVNIALMNELVIAAKAAEVSVHDIIIAANTKRELTNPYVPGLVGGHCIAVDPWLYVDGFNERPSLAATAREVNDRMASVIADILGKPSKSVAILGAAFKANCSDVRNSGSAKLAYTLLDKGWQDVVLIDPMVDAKTFLKDFPDLLFIESIPDASRQAVIVTLEHDKYPITESILRLLKPSGMLIDPFALVPGFKRICEKQNLVYCTL